MTWATTVLSTSDSIARWESNINNLTDDDWSDKITAAKDLIKDEILQYLDDTSQLDNIPDAADVFGVASDYLTLSLIYEDISKGNIQGSYITKRDIYRDLYISKIRQSLSILSKYVNNNNTVIKRSFSSGRLVR